MFQYQYCSLTPNILPLHLSPLEKRQRPLHATVSLCCGGGSPSPRVATVGPTDDDRPWVFLGKRKGKMEDHHPFYGINYGNASPYDHFGSGQHFLTHQNADYLSAGAQLADLPPPMFGNDGNDHEDVVADLEDFQSLWHLLFDPDQPVCDSYRQEAQSYGEVVAVGGGGGNNNDDYFQNVPAALASVPTFDCSSCQVLRQITHHHYQYNTCVKLEIHGTLGMISHAVAERKNANAVSGDTSAGDTQFEMLDFSSKGSEEVKQFLTTYCLQRSEEGYVMSVDPLVVFYEALSVGQPMSQILGTNEPLVLLPENNNSVGDSNPSIVEVQQQVQDLGARPAIGRRRDAVNPNLSLSEQRRRTSKLQLADLREVFHFALNKAAERMEVCATVLKKICRRHGVHRWPYRKVERDKKRIAELEQKLNSRYAEVRLEAQAEIDRLRNDITVACGGINIF